MSSLNKVMTRKEAECFRALTRWQRCYYGRQFLSAFAPPLPLKVDFQSASFLTTFIFVGLLIAFSPFILCAWLIKSIYCTLQYPARLILSYIKPRDLRAPGERNLQGLHYQFARYIDLPPELYLQCLDEWVAILYGVEKIPSYSIKRYLDAEYLLHRQRIDHGHTTAELVLSQISIAREELSRELGNY